MRMTLGIRRQDQRTVHRRKNGGQRGGERRRNGGVNSSFFGVWEKGPMHAVNIVAYVTKEHKAT